MYACKVASIISPRHCKVASGDKEHGCIYEWMNGTKSDDDVSIQTIASPTYSDDHDRFSHV